MIARIPVLDVWPTIEGGRFPIKSVVGESFEIRARVFAEKQFKIGASVILTGPEGADRPEALMRHVGNDYWIARVVADEPGEWTYRIQTWSDPYETWLRNAPLRIEAGVDVELTLEAGARLLERSLVADLALNNEIALVRDQGAPLVDRLAAGMSFSAEFATNPTRDNVGISPSYPLQVDRVRALFGSWYECFPRSEGAYRSGGHKVVPGNFVTASMRLEAIAEMGFDVVCLPPIHPIGTVDRKGANGSPICNDDDPGSPWAIGSAEGGHDSIHPGLGTFDDFDGFVRTAHKLGLEIALDFALQCAPDHPWASEHREWFTTRTDGTIGFAESPPRKCEDIYPLTFDNDFDGLCEEIVRMLRFWIEHGVRIFRVDNPHTKPLSAWHRIVSTIRRSDPDVIFLAEAFTDPAMAHALAIVGFQQSYTYITRHEHKAETGAYLRELASETSHFLRPNLVVNTPDMLPRYLQSGEPAIFKARAALAATGSPNWGMYAGFELCEHEPLAPGVEDYLDSEKYEIKVRDWQRADTLAPFIAALNRIRRRHPALQQLRDLHLHNCDDPTVLCFSKRTDDDLVVVVVDLEPRGTKSVRLGLNLPGLGLDWGDSISMTDELTGNFVNPNSVPISVEHPAVICSVTQ